MESHWFGNNDAIQLTKDQIVVLTGELEKANEELLKFAVSEGIPGLNKQIEDTDANMKRLRVEIEGTRARMEEINAPRKNVMVYDVAEEKRRAENLKMYEEKLAKMKAEMDAETRRSVALRNAREQIDIEVDEKATERVKQRTEALEIQADTYHMTAVEAAVYQMQLDKVASDEIRANAAALERLEEIKREEEARNKLLKEREFLLGGKPKYDPFLEDDPTQKFKEDFSIRRHEPADTDFEELMHSLEWAVNLGITPVQRLEEEFAKLDRLLKTGLIGPEVYEEKIKALGDALTDSVMTPAERAAEKIAEYDLMLSKGAITQETYNKLLAQTKQAVDALAMSSGFADFGAKIQDLLMRNEVPPTGATVGPFVDRFAGIGEPVPFRENRFAGIGELVPFKGAEHIGSPAGGTS